MPYSRVTAHPKGKKSEEKRWRYTWIWSVRLRRIRENSIKAAATIPLLPKEQRTAPICTRYTQRSASVHTHTLSSLSVYSAPLSQTVRLPQDWGNRKNDPWSSQPIWLKGNQKTGFQLPTSSWEPAMFLGSYQHMLSPHLSVHFEPLQHLIHPSP